MELREIQSFILLARTHRILEATRELRLTPGAVHKHLKLLEAELGVPLDERREGALHLTAAGEAPFPHFLDVLDRREATIRAVLDSREETAGSIQGMGTDEEPLLISVKPQNLSFRARDIL